MSGSQTKPVADPGAEAGDQSFGLMRIADALLALPIAAIREVVAGQSTYDVLPIKAEGLLGAVDIRGTIIPVLDLRPVLGLTLAERREHVIAIMRWQGHLIGLTVDGVLGIARVPAAELFTLATARPDSSGPLAAGAFRNNGAIVTVLDAQRIAERPNMPLVAEKASGADLNVRAITESIILFTCGDSGFGIDATHVDATVPEVKIERHAVAAAASYCLGVIHHHGYDVPVVDTRAAVGMAAPPRSSASATVVVVRFSDHAMLGFAIDAVRDFVRMPASDILPMPTLDAGGPSLFRGIMVDASGRQSLLLDWTRICADPDLLLLASYRRPSIKPSSGPANRAAAKDPNAAGATVPVLTYIVGAEQATRLDQISEILTYPTDIAPFDLWGPATIGLFSHRGRVTPLVCLATLSGQTRAFDRDNARILFVEDGDKTAGFVVESLLSIQDASLHAAGPRAPGDDRSVLGSIVTIGHGERLHMVSHIDLVAKVRQVYGSTSPSKAREIRSATPRNGATGAF